MYDIVPGALQHLREADILSKTGLAVAAQGQEYSRSGAVHSTYRQGARLSGIVEVISASFMQDAPGTAATGAAKAIEASTSRSYLATVEIDDAGVWHFNCACTPVPSGSSPLRLCAHAAGLLYFWLARPFAFAASPPVPVPPSPAPSLANLPGQPYDSRVVDGTARATPEPPALSGLPVASSPLSSLSAVSTIKNRPATAAPSPAAPVKTADSLALLALADLRGIAKEYGLPANGLSKQELIDVILSALRKPEVVRRVVGTLEKTQRQFLATFSLAGGFLSDQELRELFERFALGTPEQFQQVLAKLQGKGLIMRASFNSAQQLRASLTGPNSMSSLNPLEATWHLPPEAQAALPITLPVTLFDAEEQPTPPAIQLAEPYRLLADLLLVARALDGQVTVREERRPERRGITGSLMRAAAPTGSSPSSASSPEGSMAVPPPAGLPQPALLEMLQSAVMLPPVFLRFAYRILRLGEILYIDTEMAQTAQAQAGTSVTLRMLPNATELLLGPTRDEVTVELFSHWLRQPTYLELFELAEAGLRMRCRTVSPNQPALRQGELEAENREARQWFISLLAQAPTRQWISFPAFARFVFRLFPAFLERRQHLFPAPHWWIEQEEGRPLHPEQWNDWQRAEWRYLTQLLQGPLYWWGACDIALSPNGQLLAFRLTSLAERLFHSPGLVGAGAASSPALWLAEAPFDVGTAEQERFGEPLEANESAIYDMSGIELSEQGEILVVSSAGNWPLIDLVERFTRVKGVQAGRLRYQITPAALGEALRRGEDLAPFLDLLRCARESWQGDGPLEEMLRRLEQRVASYGRTRLYTGVTLLATADTITLRELAATTGIEQQVIYAISPTLLVLKKQGGDQLIDELKRRGQAPLLHGEE